MVLRQRKRVPRGARGGMVQAERRKTDVRLSAALMTRVEKTCLLLGQTKNGLFVMAAAYLCALMQPLVDGELDSDEARGFLEREVLQVLRKSAAE